MKQIEKDRSILKRLVESYGKDDVLNFVRHLNESAIIDQGLNNVINDADIYEISLSEAQNKLQYNWIIENGKPVPGIPKHKDVAYLIDGLESCKELYYGETAAATSPFIEYFTDICADKNVVNQFFNNAIIYNEEDNMFLSAEYSANKVETNNYIVIVFGNDWGDDSGQVIVGLK